MSEITRTLLEETQDHVEQARAKTARTRKPRQRERLFQPDVELTMWRRFASKHARGIQTVEHTRGYFKRD